MLNTVYKQTYNWGGPACTISLAHEHMSSDQNPIAG